LLSLAFNPALISSAFRYSGRNDHRSVMVIYLLR
jgi:hypothetical protein